MALVAAELKVGDSSTQVLVDNLTRTQIVQYAGASGDFNPIHTDEIYATQVAGYPTVLAHGMLTMGLAGRAITDYLGDGRLKSFSVRFKAQVWPGDTLSASVTIDGVGERDGVSTVDLSVVLVNQDSIEVLVGRALGVVAA